MAMYRLLTFWFLCVLLAAGGAFAQPSSGFGPQPGPASNIVPGTNLSAGNVTATGGQTKTLANWQATIGNNTFNPVTDHAAPTNGTSDATTAISASLTDCSNAGGGTVVFEAAYQFQYTTLTVPTHCALHGMYTPGADGAGSKYSTTQPALVWSGTGSGITFNADSAAFDLAVFNAAPIAISTTTIRGALNYVAAFAGTAITVSSPSVQLRDLFIIGFSTCVNGTNADYISMTHVSGDCLNPLYLNNVQAYPGLLDDINWHTFLPIGTATADYSQPITGVADNGSGLIRLTVGSTATFLTGDTGYISGVGGFTGANGRYVVTVVNGTHLDLQGSATSPSLSGYWFAGSNMVSFSSVAGLWVGQNVSGSGIVSGTTITYIDFQSNSIWLSNVPSGGGSFVTLTFSNPAYTSGGVIYLSADTRTGTATQIINSVFVAISNSLQYGWAVGYSISGTSGGNQLINASCDAEQLFDPNSVCVINAATQSGTNYWIGGSTASAMSAYYDKSLGVGNVSGVSISAQMVGSVPISLDSDRISIANSVLTNAAGVTLAPGNVLLAVLPGTGYVALSGDYFALANLVVNNAEIAALSRVNVDWSTAINGWLYGPGGQNMLLNGGFVLDQPNEGGTYTNGVSNNPMMDGWHQQASSGGSWTFQKTTTTAPNAGNEMLFTVIGNYAPGSSDFILAENRIEANQIGQTGFGTANARPLSLSFLQKCSVTGTYAVNVSNGANNRTLTEAYSLIAGAWTLETFVLPGDLNGTWTDTGNGTGLQVVFPIVSGTGNQTSTYGSWQSGGGNITGANGQVNLISTNGATCEWANVKLEISSHPTVFVPRTMSQELAFAQRYYRKSFPQGTAPAQNAAVAGARCVQNPIATGKPSVYVPFDPPMASAPSVTTYNPSAANANWRDVTGSADVTVSVDPSTALGVSGVEIGTGATVATGGDNLCIHYTADSRL